MTDKIQSMSKGTEELSERIHTVEFDNQNLLKIYYRSQEMSSSDGPTLQKTEHLTEVKC